MRSNGTPSAKRRRSKPRLPRVPTELRAVVDSRGGAALGVLLGLKERVGALSQYVSTVLLGFRAIRHLGSKGTRPKSTARRAVEYLERQKAIGYQDLLYTIVVFLWGLVESGLEDVATVWLAHSETEQLSDAVWKVRLRAAEFMTRDRMGQAASIVEALKGELRHQHSGIDLFDALFREVGIAGYVTTPVLRRALVEMQQARNVILHKVGIVDERFCRACGWRRETPGAPLRLTADDVDSYARAAQCYIQTLGSAILVQSVPGRRGPARRTGRNQGRRKPKPHTRA